MRGGLSTAFSRIRAYLDLVKFEHTIFALPFAYMGMVLAANGLPSVSTFVWITLAMVGARTTAMASNRLIDREVDAKNPRTAGRPLQRKLILTSEVWYLVAASLLLLVVSAWMLNDLCLKLLPIAAVVLVGYSYAKWHTWACHYVLGLAIGAAPVGAWAAVTGSLSPTAVLLWVAVGAWISGFDIIYACQDSDFDRANGVKSIPAVFGVGAALIISALTHLVTLLALVGVGFVLSLSPFYWLGVAAAALLLAYEHWVVRPGDLSRLDVAFFNVNGYISIILLSTTLVAVFWK